MRCERPGDFALDLRDARLRADPIDACAIARDELGGARVLRCRVTIETATTTAVPSTITTTLPYG